MDIGCVGTQAGDLGCDRHGQCEKGGQAALHMETRAGGSSVFCERWGSVPGTQLWAWREWMGSGVTSAAQPCMWPTNTEWCVRSGGRIALSVDDKLVGLKSKRETSEAS